MEAHTLDRVETVDLSDVKPYRLRRAGWAPDTTECSRVVCRCGWTTLVGVGHEDSFMVLHALHPEVPAGREPVAAT